MTVNGASETHHADTRIIELRKRLLTFAEDGARVFITNRIGAATACVSGFVVSLTLEHVAVDVCGRSVVLQLARIVECREHRRKSDAMQSPAPETKS